MKQELQKITDYLLLKSSFIQDIGLFHGKMGIVLALYLYADKCQDKLLQEYAWELFQQIHEHVHTDMPVGLEYGLAGIGYATTLLYKHGLVDCDLNDVLSAVDSKIMERDPRRMTDLSVRTGAGGVLSYIRLRGTIGEPLTSFDKLYLTELRQTTISIKGNELPSNLMDILRQPSFTLEEYVEKPWGIDEGSAYYLLKSVLS